MLSDNDIILAKLAASEASEYFAAAYWNREPARKEFLIAKAIGAFEETAKHLGMMVVQATEESTDGDAETKIFGPTDREHMAGCREGVSPLSAAPRTGT